MRYLIEGEIIRSENAAKSYKQKSKFVSNYLRARPSSNRVMDFGCGKLRYSDEIVSISKQVVFLDSDLQLSRSQMVRGVSTSVAEYVSTHYAHAQILSFESAVAQGVHSCFDFINCSNVLSAIPCVDYLQSALSIIYSALRGGGEALFVNQFRCSSFSKFESGRRHMYGYIYKARLGYTYYGVMTNDVVVDLLVPLGFEVVNVWSEEDVGFVLVRRPHTVIA